jgi:hypothetical protein
MHNESLSAAAVPPALDDLRKRGRRHARRLLVVPSERVAAEAEAPPFRAKRQSPSTTRPLTGPAVNATP